MQRHEIELIPGVEQPLRWMKKYIYWATTLILI